MWKFLKWVSLAGVRTEVSEIMSEMLSNELLERASRVRLLLMDCDGVLTDGKLYFSKNGEELKTFHVHDGQGLKLWHNAGFKSGIITGRESKILLKRTSEIGINFVFQNSKDKVGDFKKILGQSGVVADEVAYVGDDLSDVELLKSVGFPVLVADSPINLDDCLHYKTLKNGGCGAIREVVDFILKLNVK